MLNHQGVDNFTRREVVSGGMVGGTNAFSHGALHAALSQHRYGALIGMRVVDSERTEVVTVKDHPNREGEK